MQILTWILALEIGMLPGGNAFMYEPEQFEQVDMIAEGYVSFDAEVQLLDIFFVGGGVKIPTSIIDPPGDQEISGWPTSLSSLFVAGLRYGGFELGFRHLCAHPVAAYHEMLGGTFKSDLWYEEIYLQLELSNKEK